jgi:eukaryotic-like serine/threonine-protein kinase
LSQRAAAPDPGEIAGRYEVVKRLGAGAFGTVYKAKDRVLGRMLAIKTIRLEGLAASGASIEELMDRFKREAQISAQLRHPNIVTIYDVGESDGMSYLAMEFIDGVGLDRVIATAGRLPLERAALIGAQVADALDFAHQHSVVHRDIKPANIMIEAGDRVKVTDFGIAKVTDSGEHLTMTGSLLGTPSYMSPEQAKGGRLDGRSDLFAVGAILYEMLAGQKAFRGDSITGLIFKIITEEPQLITDLDPSLPGDLVKVVHKALNKAPELRYQSGREMAEDLLAFTRAGASPTLRQGEIDTMRGGQHGNAPTLAGISATMSEAPTQNRAATQARAGQATELSRPTSAPQEPTHLMGSGGVKAPAVDPTHHMASGSRPAPAPPPPAPPAHTASVPPRPAGQSAVMPARSARIAQPEKSKAGLVVGLIAVFVLVLLGAGGGGLYYFVLRQPSPSPPPSTLVAEMSPGPSTAPVTTPAITPSTEPTALLASPAAVTPTPAPTAATTVAPTPAPPATQPANQGGTRVADGGLPHTGTQVPPPDSRGATRAGSELAVLDVEPPELNGREAGASVADTYRNRGGFGNQNNSSFGATGRLRARGKVPRDLSQPERRAAIVLLNLMGLEAVHHRQNGRYGNLQEVLPAHAGSPTQIDRAGYRFQLKVETDGYAITATSANGRALIADDSGFVRFADE